MRIDIKHYTRGSSDGILSLSKARETGTGRVLLEAAELKISEEQRAVVRRPRRDEADLTNDLYFRLGFIAGLNWLLDLEPSARALLTGIAGDDGAEDDSPMRSKQGLPA